MRDFHSSATSELSHPRFTVIIPTKDRAAYLYHTLRTCMIQDYENLEVIVSDDGSTDETRDVVEDLARKDSRIRYISQGGGVGMRDNFEIALREAKSGYVIALGGDDGLLPDGIKGMHEVMCSTGLDLLSWPAPLYSYPKVRGSRAQLAMYNRNGISIIESKDFLGRQSKNLHYLSDIESPMFYVKGVASTKLIDKVRSRSVDGRFYSCPTPDGYSGIVLAGEVERFVFSGRPFSIYGLSPTSQGRSYLSNDENAKKTSEAFYQNVASRPMHPELASQSYSPLITLMTVDYLLTAKDLPGWGGVIPEIDFKQVLDGGLKELAHGLYGKERVGRELLILSKVAELHGLGDYFRGKVRSSKRYRTKSPFEGSGISPTSFFFDGETFKLNNILDASYAAHNYHTLYSVSKPKSALGMLFKSLKYKFQSAAKGDPFPPESEWE